MPAHHLWEPTSDLAEFHLELVQESSSIICATTAGHMIFMDSSTIECTPDVTESSVGGSWQGLLLVQQKQVMDLGMIMECYGRLEILNLIQTTTLQL